MLRVSGCLSSLFTVKNNVLICNWQEICDTMVNKPITDANHNPIGIITDVDVENDTWSGYLMKNDFAEMTMDFQNCTSIVVK